MDWQECKKDGIIKEVKEDVNLIKSTIEVVNIKIESAKALPENHYIGKITLLYDSLRGLLEALSLKKGYKIYNHECYAAFLTEILNLSKEASSFDSLRRIRNGINYYGRKLTDEEAEYTLKEINSLINKLKALI